LAQETLKELLRELHEATAESTQDLAHLHQVRIIGKRLRYSMEIFADCFEDLFREHLYPQVEAMQDVLGTLNDSRVAVERLALLRERLRAASPADWRSAKPEIDYWTRYHQRRLQRQRQLYRKWLERWQASRAENEFRTLLELANVAPE
jgi:CHAD domain-containing protein